ncbi:DUF29 domain-containing protein [Candidatus Magnetobacterium casense]|uniref:DUF29 family protein n=1 Tax=Candidatus Magnetobacterium casense TaxID=1455061 RepID=A0ABS6S032_9BACT|nr:DUF29 domain-containing protein [Candidatus Magnetobacterium casensis]MBV6342229.1 DUF29 family protein [Candidatus Magnetobacterium casensis]
MTQVFSGMIIECEIMGVKGTGPLAGGSEGGRSRPFLSLLLGGVNYYPIAKGFIEAKRTFEDETGINTRELPETCLYTFDQLMDYSFRPE